MEPPAFGLREPERPQGRHAAAPIGGRGRGDIAGQRVARGDMEDRCAWQQRHQDVREGPGLLFVVGQEHDIVRGQRPGHAHGDQSKVHETAFVFCSAEAGQASPSRGAMAS